MKRTIRTALLTAIAVVGGLVIPVSAASAVPPPPTLKFYKTAYSDDIYVVERGETFTLSFEDWAYFDYPTPQPSPTEYVKYPWAPTVYAVTFWADGWMWDTLDFGLWQRAGYPAPRNAGYIEGSDFYQYDSSSELFVYTEADDVVHKLSFAEWRDSAFQAPYAVSGGFYQLSWTGDPTIVYQNSATGEATPISFGTWQYEAFPTPAKTPRLFGDSFYQFTGEETVYYDGPTLESYPLTLQEWIGAGQPIPEIVG